jgi:hypothetical protein
MIHHISLAVHNPLRVAQIVAELWQGRAVPFPHHPGSYMALSFDSYGTAIEFFPKGTVLKPDSDSVGFYNSNSDAGYTATHANLAVPISETQIYEIADREGWRAVRCQRAGLIDLIEFWVENEVMLELIPPSLMERYRATVEPENLKKLLASGALDRN